MTDNNAVEEETQPLSAADYRDPNFAEMQILSDYVMKYSIPKDMTIGESQRVVNILMDLLDLTIYNLNLLRNLAGEKNYELTEAERTKIENAKVSEV